MPESEGCDNQTFVRSCPDFRKTFPDFHFYHFNTFIDFNSPLCVHEFTRVPFDYFFSKTLFFCPQTVAAEFLTKKFCQNF